MIIIYRAAWSESNDAFGSTVTCEQFQAALTAAGLESRIEEDMETDWGYDWAPGEPVSDEVFTQVQEICLGLYGGAQ